MLLTYVHAYVPHDISLHTRQAVLEAQAAKKAAGKAAHEAKQALIKKQQETEKAAKAEGKKKSVKQERRR